MKKVIIIGALLLIIGIAIGLLCRPNSSHKGENQPQKDAIILFDTITHSKLELAQNALKLDLPNTGVKELVFIQEDSTTIIYRDSVRYVTYPREYFYTKTKDAEIWHSGIDSTIDSLNVVRKTEVITKTIQPVTKRNTLGIGIETSYFAAASIMPFVEYEYSPKPWVSIYGQVGYDLPTQLWGFGMGAKIQISW